MTKHGVFRFNEVIYYTFLMQDDRRKYFVPIDKVKELDTVKLGFFPFTHFIPATKQDEEFVKNNSDSIFIPEKAFDAIFFRKRYNERLKTNYYEDKKRYGVEDEEDEDYYNKSEKSYSDYKPENQDRVKREVLTATK